MPKVIGIRREDKSIWERRCPLIPEDIGQLIATHNIRCLVQPSDIRIFKAEEFLQAGAVMEEDLGQADIIFGVKEVPKEKLCPGKTYIFFAHVIKGQKYNMPMLQRLMDLKCSLIDYEKIVDASNKRLIFFGRHAGLAGMIDSLHAFGLRFSRLGQDTPFSRIKIAHDYDSLNDAKKAVAAVADLIRADGIPAAFRPFVVGVTGYGNVSRGAQEILDILPIVEIQPDELPKVAAYPELYKHKVVKVVFKEEHMVKPRQINDRFSLPDYFNHPEKYESDFDKYLPYLSMLINCIYWDSRYPRLVTKAKLKEIYAGPNTPKLQVIGDISCDIDGSIEATAKATEPGEPNFVYEPQSGRIIDGVSGNGPVIMAVDILPSEISRDASYDFSHVLKNFVPHLLQSDFSQDFEHCNLIPELKGAMILYKGALTPNYQYIAQHL
jgi:alpha-aminoadipic semialdehyde synthase